MDNDKQIYGTICKDYIITILSNITNWPLFLYYIFLFHWPPQLWSSPAAGVALLSSAGERSLSEQSAAALPHFWPPERLEGWKNWRNGGEWRDLRVMVAHRQPYLLEVPHHLRSYPCFPAGVEWGVRLGCLQSCLSLHQPATLNLQELLGPLYGHAMWGDVPPIAEHTGANSNRLAVTFSVHKDQIAQFMYLEIP